MNPAAWKECFEALRQFKRRFRHCQVPPHWRENPQLARWVSVQRNVSGLTFEQIVRLRSLGFDFGGWWNQWLDNFFRLVRYRKKQGHCRVPNSTKVDEATRRLACWVRTQRTDRGRLSIEQKRMLDDIDFDWSPIESLWHQRYHELEAFQRQHGHCDLRMESLFNPVLLHWVNRQRRLHHKNRLPRERHRLLSTIGMEWAQERLPWRRRWREFETYLRKHGTEELSQLVSRNRSLHQWLWRQRRHADTRTPEQRRLFARSGVPLVWERRPTFEDRIEQLRRYKRAHGHCDVSTRDDRSLAVWICNQRRGRSPRARAQRRVLERMGIPRGSFLDSSWEKQYQAWCEFRRHHGHGDIHTHHTPNKRLRRWIQAQRERRTAGKLREDRRRRLARLGFIWNTDQASWEKYCRQLEAFKRRHGHCNVRRGDTSDKELYDWAGRQRTGLRQGRLSKYRQRRLERMGFGWDLAQVAWGRRVAQLQALRRQLGRFPTSSALGEHPGLRQWVFRQRRRLQAGEMDSELKAELMAIGWV